MFRFFRSFLSPPPVRKTWEVRDELGRVEVTFQNLNRRREAKIKASFEWLDQIKRDLEGKYLVHWDGHNYTYYIVNDTFTSLRGETLWRLNLFDKNVLNQSIQEIDFKFTIGISLGEDNYSRASSTINVEFQIEASVTVFSEGMPLFEFAYDYEHDDDYDLMVEESDSISYQKNAVRKLIKEVRRIEKSLNGQT